MKPSVIVLLLSIVLALNTAQAAGSVTVKSPNGGECLIPGSEITVSWTGSEFDHVAIGYKTDGSTPNEWKKNAGEWDVHPAYGTTFKWEVPNINSKTVKLWVEAHSSSDNKISLDSSDKVFTISDTCGTEEVTIKPEVTEITIEGKTYQPSDPITLRRGVDLTLKGTGEAGQAFTLFVKSAEKLFTVTVGQDGKWQFDVWTKDLEEGEHSLEIESPTSQRESVLTFSVSQVEETTPVSASTKEKVSTEKVDNVQLSNLPLPIWALAGSIFAVVAAAFTVFIISSRRNRRIEQSYSEPPQIS